MRESPACRRATGSSYPGYAIVAMLLYYVKARAGHVIVSSAMEEDDFHSSKKKRWTRKVESRFPTMSEEEMAEISKLFVPSNTVKNTQWALSCFVSGEARGTPLRAMDNDSVLPISLRIL